jgi:hypothetical protein
MPWAEEREAHRAADEDRIGARSGTRRSRPILSVTFAPPTIATSGALGSSRMPVSVRTSRSSSGPRRARQRVRDALRRGVRAVGARRTRRRCLHLEVVQRLHARLEDLLGQVDDAARVPPLVVVPADDLDQCVPSMTEVRPPSTIDEWLSLTMSVETI